MTCPSKILIKKRKIKGLQRPHFCKAEQLKLQCDSLTQKYNLIWLELQQINMGLTFLTVLNTNRGLRQIKSANVKVDT